MVVEALLPLLCSKPPDQNVPLGRVTACSELVYSFEVTALKPDLVSFEGQQVSPVFLSVPLTFSTLYVRLPSGAPVLLVSLLFGELPGPYELLIRASFSLTTTRKSLRIAAKLLIHEHLRSLLLIILIRKSIFSASAIGGPALLANMEIWSFMY